MGAADTAPGLGATGARGGGHCGGAALCLAGSPSPELRAHLQAWSWQRDILTGPMKPSSPVLVKGLSETGAPATVTGTVCRWEDDGQVGSWGPVGPAGGRRRGAPARMGCPCLPGGKRLPRPECLPAETPRGAPHPRGLCGLSSPPSPAPGWAQWVLAGPPGLPSPPDPATGPPVLWNMAPTERSGRGTHLKDALGDAEQAVVGRGGCAGVDADLSHLVRFTEIWGPFHLHNTHAS